MLSMHRNLKDPVSTLCGHSYCRQCKMQSKHAEGHYGCPTCKKRWKTQPKINTDSPISKQPQLANSSSACEQLSCDFCPVKKLRAVKFCLMCTALYCETHAIQHYTVPALQRHRLVEPMDHLEQMICQDHQRALEMFCRTDQISICSLCAVLKHQHHDIMIENPKQSNGPWPGVSTALCRKASRVDTAVENRELRMENRLHREIIMQLRKVKASQKNKEAMREKKHAEETRQMEEHMSTLETGNAKLKKHNNKLRRKMSKLKKHIHLKKDERPLVAIIKHQRRHAFPARVTLDFYTAHRRLILSDDKRNVKLSGCARRSHNQQHGLGGQPFVLGRKGFTSGRRFWQVGVNNRWTIGVTRASAQRTESVSFYPHHGYWCLSCWMQFLALTSPIHRLPKDSVPRELGICLDVDEKWVSFYNAESKAHIYTFTNMDFREGEEIYPVFCTQDEEEQEIKIRRQPILPCPIFVSDQKMVQTGEAGNKFVQTGIQTLATQKSTI
ncbi:E3 ubiquitin-protein ligase TRIM39-like [Sardina pilchardus]|uniref:E3 ubiquitin-protein ligase TRIM39-like n=1 Tax=Sardina pilchardus TaxID=27697 RepID=UPI002E15C65B